MVLRDQMPETEDPETLVWNLENLHKLALQAREKIDFGVTISEQKPVFFRGNWICRNWMYRFRTIAAPKVLTSGESVPRSYFFGLSADSPSMAPSRASAFFYNSLNKTGFAPAPDFNYFVLLEMFCAANHGRTTGYKIRDAKVVPQT